MLQAPHNLGHVGTSVSETTVTNKSWFDDETKTSGVKPFHNSVLQCAYLLPKESWMITSFLLCSFQQLKQENHELRMRSESLESEYEMTIKELQNDVTTLRKELDEQQTQHVQGDRSRSQIVHELTQQNERLTEQLKKVGIYSLTIHWTHLRGLSAFAAQVRRHLALPGSFYEICVDLNVTADVMWKISNTESVANLRVTLTFRGMSTPRKVVHSSTSSVLCDAQVAGLLDLRAPVFPDMYLE